ncbi:tRNA 2-selenouridine(34) synthase MnmH [Ideonella livida]|uniref:tRNA 2-selenouridine(34) synthase MnmH n=1 Tax=Ideonella livida TaxID=2707176 RepID=A0A7C9TMJ1_9BURK|nr:tRNA 2-selenouridine(34) synthase MnmH [Ideonella livida]NDY93362.1 tRNA 2-selenouridine(34) synthase MnmH [Ideonella livida]
MSPPRPVTPERVGEFSTVIDARSPSEFAEDHLPGAVNCPVLDDEERRIVGTIYKTTGAFEARRIGGAMVAANLSRHLRERFSHQPPEWRPLVYCWRGGLRSGSMVAWLRLVGWDAQILQGGYKRWRGHVIEQIDHLAPQLRLQVVAGATGSGKTRLLAALAQAGAQVLDLEALARHRGSLLGAWPGQPQPSQKAFESALFQRLRALDLSQPVWVEAESRKIGRVALPTTVLDRLRASPCWVVQAPAQARLPLLLEDYAHLGRDTRPLLALLQSLQGQQPNERLDRWRAWTQAADLPPLFAELIEHHYDPAYQRSQRSDYLQWDQGRTVALERLDAPALAQAARLLMGQVPGPAGTGQA